MRIDGVVRLAAGGAGIVVDATAGTSPRILHLGADVGDVDGAALRDAVDRALVPSGFDEPTRLGLVPTEADGWIGRPGIAGSRGRRQLLPLLTTTSAALADDGGDRQILTVEADDATAAITITTTVVLEPSGVVRIRHAVTNRGETPLQLAALDVTAPVPPIATELLDFGGRWCAERTPMRTALLGGARVREVRRGRPCHDAPMLMVAGTPGFGFRRGEVWAMHVEWSGDQVYAVERLPEGAGAGAAVLRGGELLRPGEVELAHGETYETPPVTFVWSDAGLDGVSSRIHRMLRARPRHPRAPRPVVLNTWEAVYFDHDLGRLRELARVAAELGVERFVLDDGWFRGRRDDTAGLGDWTVDPDVWPHGLHPLVDEVRALGMQIGLWVEPEMVNRDSDLAREHPTRVLGPAERDPLTWRSQQVLDVADPAIGELLFARLDALVREYRLDFLKWDHNRDLTEAVDADGVAAVHRQTRATYALLDRLRAVHPELEIESCASGGARVDLGILARTDRVWASDTTDAIERQSIQHWTTLLIPPELVGGHVSGPVAHTTARRLSLAFRCLTSLFVSAGIEWDVTQCTPREREMLRSFGALHKELRPLLHGGDVVRADDVPDGLLLHGVVATDRREAAQALVRLTSSQDAAPGPLRLPGLDRGMTYTVRVRGDFFDARRRNRRPPPWWDAACGDGFVVSGAVLTTVGLQFPALMPGEGLLLHAKG